MVHVRPSAVAVDSPFASGDVRKKHRKVDADTVRRELDENGDLNTMQSMQQLLGGQVQEVWQQLQHMYATSIKLLEFRDSAARSAEIEIKHLTDELSALRARTKDLKESKNVAMVAAQYRNLKQDLLHEHKAARALETENYELREQLAALQAVGSTGLHGASIPLPGEQEQPESGPEGVPPMLSESSAVPVEQPLLSRMARPVSAPVGLDRSLERLERAQLKLDKWAVAEQARPPPVTSGLVTPLEVRSMPLPPAPGTVVKIRRQSGDGSGDEPKRAMARKSKRPEAKTVEEEDDGKAEGDGFTWQYTRAARRGREERGPKTPQVLDMKERVRDLFAENPKSITDEYHESGWMQAIAKSPRFETATMLVITVNAIWIGIDLNFNPEELLVNAHPIFIVMENLFCIYFLTEIIIRFGAYRSKCTPLGDKWFLFDFALVFAMVLETWIMFVIMAATGSSSAIFDASALRVLRLFRLTRVARVAKIVRALPEIMILIRGIGVAARSVFFTVCLLMLLVYVFAIGFTQLLKETSVGDRYYKTLSDGMFTLLFHACFLNGVPDVARAMFAEHFLIGLLFMVFLIIAPLTVMNMLIGVLVEVVGVVATAEQEALQVKMVTEQVMQILTSEDADHDDYISQAEFTEMLDREEAINAFTDVGVDVIALIRDPDIIFAGDDCISFKEFMDEVLALRGSNPATVKDITQLKKQILREMQGINAGRGMGGAARQRLKVAGSVSRSASTSSGQ
eukprot:TRINITY_DN11473_c0_g1_i1.p1 TRINITY_DN11473_c0_g1~~TRINITY_DN11473_c0_g1_i1.p1  ORF type:complete len:752 (+),score=177.62 TRINITY_DN11473_c0_g1_i1:36-2258(+)